MQNPNQDLNAKNFYSKADFWDQRYQAGGYFDWYAEYPELQYAFQNQYGMSKEDHILMVGCGNSKLSEQMFEAGYKNICNIDISPTVIDQMNKLSPGMEWLVMDATQMTFEDKKFDYVIDKGTMDALIAGRDLTPAIKLLKQCMRVTKQEGQLIQITYGSPEGRKKVFQTSLPFDMFDYYFAYVNLNDMSTMINLMRNNLIGPDGQHIEKQFALQKSLKQFMMVKIMRARRSKDKQFVVWQNFTKKSENIPQPKTENKTQIIKEQVPTKVIDEENIHQNKIISETASKEQTIDKNQSKQENCNQNIKYQSKPQKQSFVYAYSIKRKFGFDFDPQQFKLAQTKQTYESNFKQTSHLQIRGKSSINQSFAQCKNYCLKKSITHSAITFTDQSSPFSNNEQNIKMDIEFGETISINVLTKANIDIKINFKDFASLNQILKKLTNHLTEKMGIPFHPCPKTYSLFTILKGRMKAKSVNELLKKYWYPTFSFKYINIESGQSLITLSTPPVIPEILAKVKQQIISYFSSRDLKLLNVTIESTKNGFISFPEIKLFSVLNMVALSYNSGKPLSVKMEDFWTYDRENLPEDKSKLFIVHNSQVKVTQKLLPLTILHLMSFW